MIPFALASLLLVSPIQWGREVRQPFDTASASGAWKLHVAPSDPSGSGPMHCRLGHDKDIAWEKDIPWTFEQAGVADDGTVVGYADLETLRIVVLDSKGAPRKQHDIAHETAIVDGPSLPCASGQVLILDRAGLAFIRVHPADQSRPSPWRTLSLATGEFGDEVKPECPGNRGEEQDVYERDARVVGDTGLILSQWWYTDYRRIDLGWPKEGGIFDLVDAKGKSVWAIEWLDDYTDRTSEKADDELEYRVQQRSPILSTGPGNQFALWNVKADQRVEFFVEKDTTASEGWSVRELARKSMPQGKAKTPAPTVESKTLKEIGRASIGLSPNVSQSPIHDIAEIGFTESGELEILRRPRSGGLSYARLSARGELVFEREFPELPGGTDAWPDMFDLSGDRWLLSFREADPPWIELDVKTGATKPCPLPAGGMDTAVAPTPDGGYLALVPQIVRSLCFTELCRVGADGSLQWKVQVTGIGPDTTEFEKAISFGSGLVRTDERSYALLGMSELTIFDLDKKVLRATPLEKLIGHEASYVSSLLPDHHGGVYFNEGDRFWHADAQGNPAGSVAPMRADGSKDPGFDHHLRVAPDGKLWTSDGSRLYRLDDSGKADLVLGPTQVDGELAEPEEATIDARGRLLVRDRFSQALHAFDSTGAKQFVFALLPAERSDDSLYDSIRSLPDGTIWMKVKDGMVHIGPGGERLGTFAQDPKSEDYFDFDEEVGKLDPTVRAFALVKRRPDGKWLTGEGGRAVLKDGRLALVADADDDGKAQALYFYSATANPIASLALPEDETGSKLSASARWIVIGSYGPTWTLVRLADQRLFKFDSGLPDGGNWHFGQTPEGHTLLLLNESRRELVRFELP